MSSETFDFDVTIRRGDDRQLAVTIYQENGVTPQNLSGASLWFTGKLHLRDSDADAVLAYTRGAGITVTSDPNGTATVQIVGADTAALPDGAIPLRCDIQVKTASGNVYTAAYGRIMVAADVTRATS